MKFLNLSDLKLLSFNSAAFMVSFTEIESTVKFLILLASLGYTIHKWMLMVKKNKPED